MRPARRPQLVPQIVTGEMHMFNHRQAPLLLIALFAATLLLGQAKVDHARSEWMQGYVKLENADKALAENNHMAAAQLYKEALLVFETVRRKYPQWNPSLLNFRVKYCQDKVDQVESKLRQEVSEMSRDKLLEQLASQAQMLHENSVKAQQLQNSLNILTESLQRARAEAARNAAAEADFDSLSQARKDLESRCQLLQNKLNKAEEDLAAWRKKSAEQSSLTKLRQDYRQQGEQLKQAQRQIETLQNEGKALAQDSQRGKAENQRLLKLTQDYEQRLGAANNRVNELGEQVNKFFAQHRDLQLKSRQQDIELNAAKQQLQRAESSQNELQEEIASLRGWREKSLAAQSAEQQLHQQVAELQNRLQENHEKQRFELEEQRRGQQELARQNEELTKQNEQLRRQVLAYNEQMSQIQSMRQEQPVPRASEEMPAAGKQPGQAEQGTDAVVTIHVPLEEELAKLKTLNLHLEEQNRLLQDTLTEQKQELQQSQEHGQSLEKKTKSLEDELNRYRGDLRHSQEYALNLERQAQKLQQGLSELASVNQQLKDKDELLAQRSLHLQEQSRKLAASSTELLVKTQALDSTQAELQNIKRKLAEAEQANAQMAAEFNRLQRRSGDFGQELEDLKAKLLRAEEERQAGLTTVKKLELQLETRGDLIARLESSLTEAEAQKKLLQKQVQEQEEQIRQTQSHLAENLNRSQAAAGMASNLQDLQKELLFKNNELAGLQKELTQALGKAELLQEQLQRREQNAQGLKQQQGSKNETLWLARMAELNRKLELEENKRKALEIALIQKESENKGQNQAPHQAAAETQAMPDSGKNQASEGQKLYTEKEILLNGFLRQGLDAEKNQKTEAAQWNYQKVLELEPAHLLALKRLGLIAANHGNDEETVKYLQLAFRYDPDDHDVLLALGFALLKQRQVEWAFSYLGRAMALQPANPALASHFAAALADLGWTQAAEQQFARCLKLQPNDADAAFNLAVLCATAQPPRLPEAKKWYEMALSNGAEKDPGLEAAFNATRQ